MPTTGLSTPEVTRLTGVPASTISAWSREGIVGEPLLASHGLRRATRYWSLADAVTIRAVRALRLAGCPLAIVRRVSVLLKEEWNATLAGAVLIWDGLDLLSITGDGEVVNVGTRVGQGAFDLVVRQTVVCPIGAWAQQAAGSAQGGPPVDITAAEQRRQRIAAARAS